MGIIDDLISFAFGPEKMAAPALPSAPPIPGAMPLNRTSAGTYVSHYGSAPPDAWGDQQGVPLREAPGGNWVSAPWMLPDHARPDMASAPTPAPITPPMPERRPAVSPFQTETVSVTPEFLADFYAGSPQAAEPVSSPNAVGAVISPAPTASPIAQDEPVDMIDRLRGFSAGYQRGGLLGALTEAAGGVDKDRKRENQTVAALTRSGLDPALADQVARDPTLLRGVMLAQAKAKVGGTKFGVTPVAMQDSKGNTVPMLIGDDGTVKRIDQMPGSEGLNLIKPRTINLGDRQETIDQLTGRTITQRNIESYQPAYDKEVGQQEGKADAEEPAKRSKAIGAYESLKRKSGIVREDIDRAINNIVTGVVPRTGMWSKLKDTPSTPQHDLNELLKGVVANLGFDELQQMRDNSPTGGALGSITEKEIAFLQALRGSLEQSQTEDQLLYNLQRAKRDYAEILRERETAFSRDFGGQPATPGASAPSPTGGQVRRRYNPATGKLE